jgi:hypothetical protein
VQLLDLREVGVITQSSEVEPYAKLYVLLRQIMTMDQHLSDLIAGIGIFTFLGVVVLQPR